MAENSESPHWDELLPDTLGFIFSHLTLEEILTVVPCVCKAWNKAVIGPYCWREIDIELWSNKHYYKTGHLDRMLQMLILRSGGSFQKLSLTGLSNDSIFNFIAQHAGSLRTLKAPNIHVNNSVFMNVAEKLSSLTSLDLSYCNKLSPEAIQAIGKHCKFLTVFCRNIHRRDLPLGASSHDEHAYAIANTMRNLKRLEIADNIVSTDGVLKILSSCKCLEFLEITGCSEVCFTNIYFKDKFPGIKVLGPEISWRAL